MDMTKGKAAIMDLAAKPARRTEAQNRKYVEGLLDEIRVARSAGYGFESISKALFNGTGVKISRDVLVRHFNRLNLNTKNLETQVYDAELFQPRASYRIIHHGDEVRTIEATYKGFFDSKYVFVCTTGNRIKRLTLSPTSLKYYTITAIPNRMI